MVNVLFIQTKFVWLCIGVWVENFSSSSNAHFRWNAYMDLWPLSVSEDKRGDFFHEMKTNKMKRFFSFANVEPLNTI